MSLQLNGRKFQPSSFLHSSHLKSTEYFSFLCPDKPWVDMASQCCQVSSLQQQSSQQVTITFPLDFTGMSQISAHCVPCAVGKFTSSTLKDPKEAHSLGLRGGAGLCTFSQRGSWCTHKLTFLKGMFSRFLLYPFIRVKVYFSKT